MTARGSSPTHEAPSEEAWQVACATYWEAKGSTYREFEPLGEEGLKDPLAMALRAAYAVDLPALRREAAALALEEAAEELLRWHLRGESDSVDAARWIANRAAALREGKD